MKEILYQMNFTFVCMTLLFVWAIYEIWALHKRIDNLEKMVHNLIPHINFREDR